MLRAEQFASAKETFKAAGVKNLSRSWGTGRHSLQFWIASCSASYTSGIGGASLQLSRGS
jgi:hypothetical protein